MNSKQNEINLDKTIEELLHHQLNFLEYQNDIDYLNCDEDEEYLTKLKYFRLINIVLYDIDKWKRNIFIATHFTDIKSEELAKLLGITQHSLYQYRGNINKEIRKIMKEKYGY